MWHFIVGYKSHFNLDVLKQILTEVVKAVTLLLNAINQSRLIPVNNGGVKPYKVLHKLMQKAH